jgi:hypothetical protein
MSVSLAEQWFSTPQAPTKEALAAKAREETALARLAYIVEAIKDAGLPLMPADIEEIPDRQGKPFAALDHALKVGTVSADEAFIMLPFAPHQFTNRNPGASRLPNHSAFWTGNYPADMLVSPAASVGRLAAMITGKAGKFIDRKFPGLYLTCMEWHEGVRKNPQLLEAIRRSRTGFSAIRNMRVNETESRDLQRPPGTPFTNFCDGTVVYQNHFELDRSLPYGRFFPYSNADANWSHVQGDCNWDRGADWNIGMHVVGELEMPQPTS